MVSKATLKAYEFKAIEEYYDYICDSLINGQYKQVKDLIDLMSTPQKKEGLKYFAGLYEVTCLGIYREAKGLIINSF